MVRERHDRFAARSASAGITVALLCLLATSAGARATRSEAECRAACEARNLPASCDWLSAEPQRCLREALKACRANTAPGPAWCVPPTDLPTCGSHHDCPYGALCVDLTCQVRACGAECAGTNRCDGNKCVVAECNALTTNCPAGFHCAPAPPPFGSVSGTCVADQPGVTHCAWDTDCIAPGNFNPKCIRGICTRQGRPFGRCASDADCAGRCTRGRTARLPRCDAAGLCLCTSCADDADCDQALACPAGRAPVCSPRGSCKCRKTAATTSSTTTTSTSTTSTDTTVASTTTTLPDEVCCCIFQIDSTWHCVHASQPSPWLCEVPWPECCDAPYTVCE